MKVYSRISFVEMVGDAVYSVIHYETNEEILKEIQGELDDGETLKDAIELCGFHTTKKGAMEESEDATTQGFGVYAGRKIWQLPVRMQNDIRRQLRVCEIS